MLTKYKYIERISFIFLFLISLKEFNSFKCGSDKLKINPGIVNTTEDYSKRRLDTEYTNIKIVVDYSDFIKPYNMDSNTYNKIKNLIDETINEFKKFIKVQHTDISLSGGKNYIKNECQLNNLDSNYERYLIDNDLLIFPSFDYPLGNYTVAAAKTCLVSSASYKPVAGNLYINKNYFSFQKKNSEIYIKHILLHEITHILIFNPFFLDFLNMIKIKEDDGEKVILVNSKKVLEKAKEHFGCHDLEGIPLENQGDVGSVGFHWESRYMLGDYMISTDYTDIVVSDITLALFEDSGFYKVNYFMGNLFKFGKNKGCDFFNKKCIENGKVLFEDEFCLYTNTPMCTHSKTFKAECLVYDYSLYNYDIPIKYQYFENPYHGGADTSDFCPVADFNYSKYDDFETSCFTGNSNLPQEYGEKISSKSFCFISSLLPSSSIYDISSKAICYEVECDTNNKRIIVKIGGSKIECPTEGGVNNPIGFKGEINCPRYSDICNFKDNEICTEIFECLKKETNFLKEEKESIEEKASDNIENEYLIKIKYLLILLYIILYF